MNFYNKCIDTTNKVFNDIISILTPSEQNKHFLSSQTVVPLSQVQNVFAIFNKFLISNNQINSNTLFEELKLDLNKINDHPKIYNGTMISLAKYMQILKLCIARLKLQTLHELDSSIFSGNDTKVITERNIKILHTAYEVMKDAYNQYSTGLLDLLLVRKTGDLNKKIQEIPDKINKLNHIYYYGSTLQRSFDILHESLLNMIKNLLTKIEQKDIDNKEMYINLECRRYPSPYCSNDEKTLRLLPDGLFPAGKLLLKEYLIGIRELLINYKQTADENIHKIINMNYDLNHHNINTTIGEYCNKAYWLIQSIYSTEEPIKSSLPLNSSETIKQFKNDYELQKSAYWPELSYETKQQIHN